MEIGRNENELHAVLQQDGFERIQIQAHVANAPRIRFNVNGEHTHPRSSKNRYRAGISRILESYRIARTQESFANQVDGLLAAIGDEELLASNMQSVRTKEFNQDALQRLVAVG